MGVFNIIFDLAVNHPSLGVRAAAILALTVASVCFVGGTAVIANGLKHEIPFIINYLKEV